MGREMLGRRWIGRSKRRGGGTGGGGEGGGEGAADHNNILPGFLVLQLNHLHTCT